MKLEDMGTCDCPKCGAVSPCTDFQSVDVGVGFYYGDETWTCPTHGDFKWFAADEKDRDGRSVVGFRDEVSPFASEGLDES